MHRKSAVVINGSKRTSGKAITILGEGKAIPPPLSKEKKRESR